MLQKFAINEKTFFDLLVKRFPLLRNEADPEDGVHLQFAALQEFAQEALVKGDWKKLGESLNFVNEILSGDTHPSVKDALVASFLEGLIPDEGHRSQFEQLLSDDLKDLWTSSNDI